MNVKFFSLNLNNTTNTSWLNLKGKKREKKAAFHKYSSSDLGKRSTQKQSSLEVTLEVAEARRFRKPSGNGSKIDQEKIVTCLAKSQALKFGAEACVTPNCKFEKYNLIKCLNYHFNLIFKGTVCKKFNFYKLF